jgi:hypothetical protein
MGRGEGRLGVEQGPTEVLVFLLDALLPEDVVVGIGV